MDRIRFFSLLIGALFTCGVLSAAAPDAAVSADAISLSNGQTLYVPGYSHIYSGDQERPVLLAVTVSIRNTDPVRSIVVTAVDYYDSDG